MRILLLTAGLAIGCPATEVENTDSTDTEDVDSDTDSDSDSDSEQYPPKSFEQFSLKNCSSFFEDKI